MERLTKRFGDKVVLPLMPISPYLDINDLEIFHKCRREYEGFAIKLAEYEDIGTIEEFSKLNKVKNLNTNEKDKFKLLEEYMREFAIKLDKIGFDVLGSNGSNSIELEIVHKENER